MSEIDNAIKVETPHAPLCIHCQKPMQLMHVHPSGGRSYFCGCRPNGGFWHNDHRIREGK